MFAEKVHEILKQYVDERHGGNCFAAAKELGVPNDTLSRWYKRERDPLAKIGPVMDKILMSYADPGEIRHIEVSFPAAKDVERDNEISRLKEEIIDLKGQLTQSKHDFNELLNRVTGASVAHVDPPPKGKNTSLLGGNTEDLPTQRLQGSLPGTG